MVFWVRVVFVYDVRLVSYYCLFFFKHKPAYELRISDWSSDVCSSDLHGGSGRHAVSWERDCRAEAANAMSAAARDHRRPQHRIQVEPLVPRRMQAVEEVQPRADRKSTRLNSSH